ncbi:MAG: M20/M25/M40 family metallo-hydrolase [Bacteroidales bacterium]|nr:MAG: M20/M25/M40 family metallo-hydrolase [Bacteroidales bacterium]
MTSFNTFVIRLIIIGLFYIFSPPDNRGQSLERDQMNRLSEAFGKKSIPAFIEFLQIPNNSYFPEQIHQNLIWLNRKFTELGFKTSILKTSTNPYLLAEWKNTSSESSVLFYAHADGQPVDPSLWNQKDPYEPVLKEKSKTGSWNIIGWSSLEERIDPEYRIFARSSSDDKGPIMMLITAIEILQHENITLPYRLKVLIDLEEEKGSPGIQYVAEKYREALKSDFLVIFDGPKHYSHLPSLTFGARGISTIRLTVYGPRMSLHSGHYGNYAPNPALRLSRLLASMKDEQGRVIIPGYYDNIKMNRDTREQLTYVPDQTDQINRSIGIHSADKVGENYQESLQYPSLNIRGLSSGWTGNEVRTIIPDKAIAEIDIRTVPESDPKRLIDLVKQHITNQGYYIINREPTDEERSDYSRIIAFESGTGYKAFRTDFNSPIGIWLYNAMMRVSCDEPVRKRISGGSVPVSPLVHILEIPAVTVPTVNPDNNQHSPNENLRLGNYLAGIKIFLAILTQPPE